MKSILLFIFFLSINKNIIAQGQSLFEQYLASLEETGQPLSYNNFIKYDTLNKENNINNWISFCFNDIVIPEDLAEKEQNVSLEIYIDTIGFVFNITSKSKSKILESFLKKKLLNKNFYHDYIAKVKINGYCISKVDEDFYKDFFKGNIVLPITFNDLSNSCNCTK